MVWILLLAKDMAPASTRRLTLKKTFKKQPSTPESYSDPYGSENAEMLSLKAESGSLSVGRHWTISGLKTRFSFKKANSFHVATREASEDVVSRRRDRSITASTFYDDENMAITRNVSEPADFVPLGLIGKNMNELLVLLKPVSQL